MEMSAIDPDMIAERKRHGQCGWGQIRVLRQYGYSANVTREQATSIINNLMSLFLNDSSFLISDFNKRSMGIFVRVEICISWSKSGTFECSKNIVISRELMLQNL